MTKPQFRGGYALFDSQTLTESPTPPTETTKTAAQQGYGNPHAPYVPGGYVSPSPFIGEGNNPNLPTAQQPAAMLTSRAAAPSCVSLAACLR